MRRFFGYKVIQKLSIGNVTFFIGYNKYSKSKYATYFRRNGEKNYSWIRFFDDRFSAQKDIVDRAYREIPMLEYLMNKEDEGNANKTNG